MNIYIYIHVRHNLDATEKMYILTAGIIISPQSLLFPPSMSVVSDTGFVPSPHSPFVKTGIFNMPFTTLCSISTVAAFVKDIETIKQRPKDAHKFLLSNSKEAEFARWAIILHW